MSHASLTHPLRPFGSPTGRPNSFIFLNKGGETIKLDGMAAYLPALALDMKLMAIHAGGHDPMDLIEKPDTRKIPWLGN